MKKNKDKYKKFKIVLIVLLTTIIIFTGLMFEKVSYAEESILDSTKELLQKFRD